jgi:hypothetical protein
LNIDPQRLFAVMNQYDARIGISPDKVGETFKHKISATIPKDPVVVLPSINRGVPFMLQKDLRSRPIAQAISELATMIPERIVQLVQAEVAVEA